MLKLMARYNVRRNRVEYDTPRHGTFVLVEQLETAEAERDALAVVLNELAEIHDAAVSGKFYLGDCGEYGQRCARAWPAADAALRFSGRLRGKP